MKDGLPSTSLFPVIVPERLALISTNCWHIISCTYCLGKLIHEYPKSGMQKMCFSRGTTLSAKSRLRDIQDGDAIGPGPVPGWCSGYALSSTLSTTSPIFRHSFVTFQASKTTDKVFFILCI